MDCLFLHVPKRLNYYRPFHRFLWVNFLPMELLGLADLIQRQGVSTQIVHMGVEWIENGAFSILSYLKEKTPPIVLLDLHWHHQSFDVIETAKAIKSAFPKTHLFLGGFTASFFHEEIMKSFDVVDGIVRGEAETPTVELTSAILQGREDFFSIPNLTWRRKGRVFINPLSYVASEQDLSRLSFTNFPLLKNYSTYIRHGALPFYIKGFSRRKNLWMSSMKAPVFHLPVGRGCPVQCTWCGGGIPNQQTISGRREVVFRGAEEVIQSIKDAVSYGYKTFHISLDPYPQKPEYYLRLFARMREEKLQIECCFESFGLPTLDFIKVFKETFPGPGSLIALSPDVGSGRVRNFHKGHAYSNRALLESLRQMEEHQVFCDLFFTLGVPFETEEDVYQTIRFQREIRRRFSNVKGIRTFTIEIEPGSPWHLNPETYGVKTSLQSFMDFYHYHSGEKSPFSSLGYWIPGYFPEVNDEKGFEKALQTIKCRHLCLIHPNTRKSSSPFWGRRRCDLSHLVWKVRDWVGKRA
ncbi:MAG: radical SAM protein [Deltaproteobacteria bacterium]